MSRQDNENPERKGHKRGRDEEKGLQKTYRERVRQEGERLKTVKPAVIGPRCCNKLNDFFQDAGLCNR